MIPERLALSHARGLIDGVDDGLVALVAARRRLVDVIASLKARMDKPARDIQREQRVQARATRLAGRLGLPAVTARRLLEVVIDDAHRQQGLPCQAGNTDMTELSTDLRCQDDEAVSQRPAVMDRLLRMLPPPHRLAPLARQIPMRWQVRVLESLMARILATPIGDGELDFLQGRRIAIEVSDLQMRWVFGMQDGSLRLCEGEPEASVRGSAANLLLLAGRLEDADTLFFQRSLVLTGDTELGLTARNLLDRLPWESIPLGLRILLNRGARFARLARAAHCGNER